jgi:hypothetical protein
MATLRPPELRRVTSQRFSVLPLWSWSLAAAEVAAAGKSYTGVGFDAVRNIARAKARSEAVERCVLAAWDHKGISPFNGRRTPLPPKAGGFAAHPRRNQAEESAFLEWRERLFLLRAHKGLERFRATSVPRMGRFFEAGLRRARCELTAIITAGRPPVSFVLGVIDGSSAIFGSACRKSEQDSLRSASAECLRKLAWLHSWKSRTETGKFHRAVRFWLSSAGVSAATAFRENAVSNTTTGEDVPSEPDIRYMNSTTVGDLWLAHYRDPAYPLPEVAGRTIPLL